MSVMQVKFTNTNQKNFKGRGPGINTSLLKNVGKIQLSIQLSYLSTIFENIWLKRL